MTIVRTSLARMFQMFVEIIHENVPGLLLDFIGFVWGARLGLDKYIAVNRMIKAGPFDVFARFLHPFVC